MDIKLELLRNYIADFVNINLEDFDIDGGGKFVVRMLKSTTKG